MNSFHEVRAMRTAEMELNIIRERGRRGLPLERLYPQLYNRDLYLRAYGGTTAQNPGSLSELPQSDSCGPLRRACALERRSRESRVTRKRCAVSRAE